MTDQDAIRDDIAFMRTLAEEGRLGPLAGGSILVASGLSFGSASLAVWAGVTYRLIHSQWTISAIWMTSMAVFLVYLFLDKAARGPRSATNRALGVAWSGAGFSIFIVGLSLVVMAVRGKDAYVGAAFMPFILAIYGSAWFVAAALARRRWLFAVSAGAFVMALVTAWFAKDGVAIYLVYALSLYALAAAPGFVLMRQAHSASV
jgi:hypothetical protein